MTESGDKTTKPIVIENLPLSSRAVNFLKTRNIRTVKDFKNLNIEDCRELDGQLADEISEIIKPYLEGSVENTPPDLKPVQNLQKKIVEKPHKIYSPFLGEDLSQEELNRAVTVPIRRLDIARFKVLIGAFRKWGVKTVGDILKLKQKRILRIRGIGRTKVDILRAIVREVVFGEDKTDKKSLYLTPTSELLLGRQLSEQEKELLRDVSVESVVDDFRARTTFRKLKIKTVLSAVCVTRERFLSTSGAGRKSIEKVIKSIEEIIKELATLNRDIQLHEEVIKHIVDQNMLARLPDEQIMILKDRYGLWDGVAETLEDIGHKLNITRQRVLQIQNKAETALRRMLIPRLFADRLFERFRGVAYEKLREDYEGLASLVDLENIIFNIDKDALVADLAYKMLKDIYSPDKNPLADGLMKCGNGGVALKNDIKEKFEKVDRALELSLVSKGKPQPPEELAITFLRQFGVDFDGLLDEEDAHFVQNVVPREWLVFLDFRRERCLQS